MSWLIIPKKIFLYVWSKTVVDWRAEDVTDETIFYLLRCHLFLCSRNSLINVQNSSGFFFYIITLYLLRSHADNCKCLLLILFSDMDTYRAFCGNGYVIVITIEWEWWSRDQSRDQDSYLILYDWDAQCAESAVLGLKHVLGAVWTKKRNLYGW